MTGHTGQTVGYVRVSTGDQRTDRQDLGDLDRVFEDKVSGSTRDRPALTEMLDYVREGDTVRVWSMDRLARSLQDLVGLVQQLVDRGVAVEFVKERLAFSPDSDDPYARFQMHVLGAVAELERSIIRERQREGIAKAKQRGVYTGRRRALSPEQVDAARERIAAGVPKAAVARDLGVSRQTLYDALRDAAITETTRPAPQVGADVAPTLRRTR